jgi:hypothetical protein
VRCSLPSARLARGVKPDDLMGLRITNPEIDRLFNVGWITLETGNGSARLGQSR